MILFLEILQILIILIDPYLHGAGLHVHPKYID